MYNRTGLNIFTIQGLIADSHSKAQGIKICMELCLPPSIGTLLPASMLLSLQCYRMTGYAGIFLFAYHSIGLM